MSDYSDGETPHIPYANGLYKFNRKSRSISILCENMLRLLPYELEEPIPLDITQIAAKLKVQKRRVYDVVNTMEATGMCQARFYEGKPRDQRISQVVSPIPVQRCQYYWYGHSAIRSMMTRLKVLGLRNTHEMPAKVAQTAQFSLKVLTQRFFMILLSQPTSSFTYTSFKEQSKELIAIAAASQPNIFATRMRRMYTIMSVLETLNLVRSAPNPQRTENAIYPNTIEAGRILQYIGPDLSEVTIATVVDVIDFTYTPKRNSKAPLPRHFRPVPTSEEVRRRVHGPARSIPKKPANGGLVSIFPGPAPQAKKRRMALQLPLNSSRLRLNPAFEHLLKTHRTPDVFVPPVKPPDTLKLVDDMPHKSSASQTKLSTAVAGTSEVYRLDGRSQLQQQPPPPAHQNPPQPLPQPHYPLQMPPQDQMGLNSLHLSQLHRGHSLAEQQYLHQASKPLSHLPLSHQPLDMGFFPNDPFSTNLLPSSHTFGGQYQTHSYSVPGTSQQPPPDYRQQLGQQDANRSIQLRKGDTVIMNGQKFSVT